jgi:hypothetical protein
MMVFLWYSYGFGQSVQELSRHLVRFLHPAVVKGFSGVMIFRDLSRMKDKEEMFGACWMPRSSSQATEVVMGLHGAVFRIYGVQTFRTSGKDVRYSLGMDRIMPHAAKLEMACWIYSMLTVTPKKLPLPDRT